MRLIRCIPAIMLALALTVSGAAPMPSMAGASMDDTGKAATPHQSMPDCPMCAPGEPADPICAPGCPAAILPLATVVPVLPIAPREIRSPAHRLADATAGPEPPPPKPMLLA